MDLVVKLTFELGTFEIALAIFAVIVLLIIVPFALVDVIRSKHLSAVAKLLWIIFIIIAPYLGAVVYLFWGRKQKTL